MHPWTRPLITAMVPVALLVAPPTVGAADAVSALATCHGRAATIVSSARDGVRGTNGDDVIVARDSGPVHSLGGDDVICLVGTSARRHEAFGGNGDDRIYVDSPHLSTLVVLGGGEDLFRGGSGPDIVYAGDHTPDVLERNVVRTGGGADAVTVRGGSGPAGDDVHLGAGNDAFDVNDAGIVRRVHGGPGTDTLRFPGHSMTLTVDNSAQRATSARRTIVDWSSMETFATVGDTTFLGTGKAETLLPYGAVVRARMGGGADVVLAQTCSADVQGGADDDRLSVAAFVGGSGCDQHATFAGGPGDDVLVGGKGPDVLVGGAGTDRADGGDGTDACSAETVTRCES